MTEQQEALLREAFNRRAIHSPRLEYRHPKIIDQTFAAMNVARSARALDIGCGSGWATRRLAKLAPDGLAVGIDVADEMVRLARRLSVELENAFFSSGSADEIPWQEDFFTIILSVDSAIFWPDPQAAVREVWRVMARGGRFFVLNSYYRENPLHSFWETVYRAQYPPVHLKGEAEWGELFANSGFQSVTHARIPDDTPVEDNFEPTDFYPTPLHKLEFRRFGALLVSGTKPSEGETA